MAKLTAHPLAAHPLMPPSSSSSENDKVILPFSKRVIDNNAAASSEGNGMMNSNQMMSNETTSSAGTIAVQNVPLPLHEKVGRNELQHNKPLSSQPPAAKPTNSNTLTAKASIKIKAKKKKQDQLNQLPRSIRWRLSLGLLTMPSTDNSSNNTTSTTTDDKKSINHSSGTLPAKDLIFDSPNQLKEANKSQEESSSAAASLLQYIEDSNALKLRCQRSRYEELEQKHYYSNTIMGIADSSSGQQQQGGAEAGGGEQQKQLQPSQQQQSQQSPHPTEAASPISSLAGNKTHVAPGDDPLSALLAASNNTTSTNQSGGNGMFGFGKGNRNKKNQTSVAPAAEDKPISEGDTTTTTTTTANNTSNQSSKKLNNNNTNTTTNGPNRRASDNSTENNEETACKGSRWADYYSTREVLDVIEKDLNRLPNDHYTIYHEWKRYNDDELIRKRVLESGGGVGSGSNNFQSGLETSSSATPTKKGERKAARQKNRFGNSFKLKDSFNFGSNINVNNPHAVHNHSSNMPGGGGDNKNAFWSNLISNQEDDEEEVDPIASPDVSRKERADRLSQLLFVYAREHPEIGYRQGMHETLSFILLALEMDLLEQCVEKEKNNWKRDIMELRRSGMGNGGGGGMAGVDSSGQIVVVRLLDQNYLLHDAFALFECVMSALAPAYDAIPAGEDATAAILEKAKEERGESPMEAMVLKIMSKIRFVARDEALFGIVLCMPVPPQIYFAKWVRLMFGREVSGGMKSVLRLWDAFFDLAAKVEHREEEVTLSLALMNVLETAAASMIILIRDKLLRPTKAWDGTLTGDPDPNDGIAYLMNYPPIEDIDNFIKVIASLLLKEKSLSQMYERQVSQDEEERYQEQVEDPFATGTGKMHDQNRRPRQVAPLSPERGSMTAQPPLYAPQPKVDVAESLGNFAAGLLDIGSRTVDAAISTYQKHQAEKQQHQSGLIDHPLQFGFNAPSRDRTPPRDRMGQGAGQGIGRSDDPYAVSYRNHTDAEPLEGQDIIVYNTNLRDSQTEEHSQKEESRGLTGNLSSSFTTKGSTSETGNENHARSDSDLASSRGGKNYLDTEEVSTSSIGIEQLENGDDRRSGLNRPRSNSRSFSSRNQSAALRKSPKSLAQKLDKSVKTLMTHFEQQQRNMMEDLSTTSTAAGGTRIIPEEIWEAMAAIDAVKKELLNQDALETLER
eukprot:scaffold12186_cov150-Skeletonema_dohrnii-CCMP3373.AAC.2